MQLQNLIDQTPDQIAAELLPLCRCGTEVLHNQIARVLHSSHFQILPVISVLIRCNECQKQREHIAKALLSMLETANAILDSETNMDNIHTKLQIEALASALLPLV